MSFAEWERTTGNGAHTAYTGGVHALLNSLTSPGLVACSLASLAPGGRFVEIAKRDIWHPARVAQERPDVCYSLLAVDFMPPPVLGGLLGRVSGQMAAGQLAPLRTAAYPVTNTPAAMRTLAQAAHVGKVVVSTSDVGRSRGLPAMHGVLGPRDGAHMVVTGGTGALGLLVARKYCTYTILSHNV